MKMGELGRHDQGKGSSSVVKGTNSSGSTLWTPKQLKAVQELMDMIVTSSEETYDPSVKKFLVEGLSHRFGIEVSPAAAARP